MHSSRRKVRRNPFSIYFLPTTILLLLIDFAQLLHAQTPVSTQADDAAGDVLASRPITNEDSQSDQSAHAPTQEFGTPGTKRILLVPMVGFAPSASETAYIMNLEADYFWRRNTSVNCHLQGFYFEQLGPNALAFGPAITLRRYFLVRPHGNCFIAGGAGLIYSDHQVPEIIGSKFNLAPRAAIGFTREIVGKSRLTGGLRVSNLDALDSSYTRTVLQPFIGLSIPLR